jgi:rsbT co-antagonist protein RsbR
MDAKVAQRLAEVLTAQRDAVLQGWVSTVRDTLRGRLTDVELRRQIEEMYGALVTALDGGATTIHTPSAGELIALLSDLSRSRAQHGFSATETAVSVFAVKEAVRGVIGEDTAALADHAAFSGFIDQLGLFTFETYVAARDALINEQAEQLLELSTPVVKLWEGIVAVPLVGTLDSARSQVVMERLLQALVDSGSPYAILDITGVPAIDTQVAQHIMKTIVAAQLMGAQCVLSGIRPQIAQTIVSLGIEFGEIVTKANLADALQYALRQQNVEIGRRANRPVV